MHAGDRLEFPWIPAGDRCTDRRYSSGVFSKSQIATVGNNTTFNSFLLLTLQ